MSRFPGPQGIRGWVEDILSDGVPSVTTDAINTEPGFISGLETEYVDASTVAIQPGTAIADDDETVITSGSTENADISTTGAGGRQSGLAEQSSSWYEVFIIAESDGANPAAFLVDDSQTTSLPSGYSTKRRVGWVRNNGSSNLSQWYQFGSQFWWDDPTNHEPLNTNSPAGSNTIGIKPQVPPDAVAAHLRTLGKGDGTSSSTHYLEVRGAQQTNGVMVGSRGWAPNSALDAEDTGYTPINDTRQITYLTNNSAQAIIRVNGWIDLR